MAPRRRRPSPEPVRVPADEQRFIKMITSNVGEVLKLQIPSGFLENNGIKLSSHVFLKVPNNVVWEMRFVEDKEQIWLHKEFIQFYSIQYGHVFIFEYNGNSNFNLIIFDMTASEINYPSSPPKTDGVSQFSDELSVEIVGDNPEANDQMELKKDKSIKEDDKTKTAMERAKSLKTNNPVIVVTVSSYYVASMAVVPKEFVKKYMLGSNGEVINNVTLEMVGSSNGGLNKQSKCKCYHSKKNQTCISWRKFVRENHVKLGDVCVFEYIKGGDDIDVIVFVVHVFSDKN